ncbi:MAG: signal peptidase II [Caldilineaceae bacterium]
MMMGKLNRILLLVFVLVSCVGCDQATKLVAQQQLASAPVREYGYGLVRLIYAENPGAFLSLGAALAPETRFWIFVVLVTLLLVGLAVFMLRQAAHTPLPMIIAIALIVGGGLSNLLDRLLHNGHVIDFMQVGVSWLHTGIFNVADMAIMAGVGLLFLLMLRREESTLLESETVGQ